MFLNTQENFVYYRECIKMSFELLSLDVIITANKKHNATQKHEEENRTAKGVRTLS